MELELTGKTALVTGASRGIGRAVALGLAKEGARVALCARDKAAPEDAAAAIRGQGGGRIVNVVGAAARNPTPGYLPGGIANAGLINFTKGLADLGAASNVLVNAISPAATATTRWETLIAQQAAAAGKSVEAYRAEVEGAYPLRRVARPEDIADLVCFLASARASFITGVCITVDGGVTRGGLPLTSGPPGASPGAPGPPLGQINYMA